MSERGGRPGVCLATAVFTAAAVLLAACGSADPGPSVDGGAPSDPLAAELDAAARAHVASPVVPGVSVAVARGGDVILQRGYGHVDLEWDVPTPAEGSASYEIGSVTKQFTAAAILLLVEEGLLDLDADFTEYIDFDTRGRSIPLRRLLDHTSGIESYTEMAAFGELAPYDLPRDTLLRLVEAEPFRFEPGTALIYNNSAYFILGRIIEAVSGTSYESFVTERLFAPAGMDDSYYCSESAIRGRRAHGYDAAGPEDLVRKGYLDHAWPYAAGSLCSTVADLVRWNRALHGGRILQPASYEAMITPRPLVDGSPVRYAMGIADVDRGDRRALAHSGGINGFTSYLAYWPESELTVVVLQNSTGAPGPGALAAQLADLVLGPGNELEGVPFEGNAGRLTGRYTGVARGQMLTAHVTAEGGEPVFRLQNERDDAPGEPLDAVHLGELRWGTEDGIVLRFVGDGDRAAELRYEAGSAHYVLRRTGA